MLLGGETCLISIGPWRLPVRENIQWVIEPGFELANRGLIILDFNIS